MGDDQHSRRESAGSAAGCAAAAAENGRCHRQRARADDAPEDAGPSRPRLMDPIGFSLENFDGIGLWRTDDEGQRIGAAAQVFDGMKIDGVGGLRKWLLGYSYQFVEVVAEKL